MRPLGQHPGDSLRDLVLVELAIVPAQLVQLDASGPEIGRPVQLASRSTLHLRALEASDSLGQLVPLGLGSPKRPAMLRSLRTQRLLLRLAGGRLARPGRLLAGGLDLAAILTRLIALLAGLIHIRQVDHSKLDI